MVKYAKEKELKRERDESTIIVGTSAPLSQHLIGELDRKSPRTKEFNNTANQKDLIGIYNALHLKREEHTFFSRTQEKYTIKPILKMFTKLKPYTVCSPTTMK